MDIIERLLPLRLPRQYIYIGEETLALFLPDKSNGSLRFHEPILPALSLPSLGDETRQHLRSLLMPQPIGLVLDPHFFIYNIFTFDRLPWKSRTRQEIVEWKLEKVFPENLANFRHRFHVIDNRTVLSILIRKEWIDSLAGSMASLGHPVTYIGNSTIEFINHLFRGKRSPDMLVEWNPSCTVVAIQKRNRLIYIRKFRIHSDSELREEMIKIVQFVHDQYGIRLKTYVIQSPAQRLPPESLSTELSGCNLSPLAENRWPALFLPVQR